MNRALVITTLFLACAGQVAAAVRISPNDGGSHSYPSVCRSSDGFVAAWESRGSDGREITIQRLDDSGQPTGAAGTANQETAGDQQLPDIACRADGSFMVVWESRQQDGDGLGIFGRNFDASGAATGNEFQIHTTTTDNQSGPRLCTSPGGAAVVVWTSVGQGSDGSGGSSGIFGQRFAADSTALGGEFRVDDADGGNPIEPAIACGSDGRSLIVWSGQRDGVAGIIARILRASGELDEREQLIATGDSGVPHHPSVAFDPRGSYVVAIETPGANLALATVDLPTGGAGSVRLRPSLELDRRNEAPIVAIDDAANIAVAWSRGAGFDFDLGGLRATPSFDSQRLTTLNSDRAGNDGAISTLGRGVAIATAADGDLVVWQKRNVFAEDSSSAIFGQRFRDCVGDCSGDGVVAVNELVRAVRIALEQDSLNVCPSIDSNRNGSIEISELIRAVNEALASICPAPLG